MPHNITWKSDGLYRKFSGHVDGDEILKSNFELQSHPNFKNIKYVINDFMDITGYSIHEVHTKVYAKTDEIAATTKGALKIALVFVEDSDITQAANNYRQQMLSNSFECENFHSLDDAQQWVKS